MDVRAPKGSDQQMKGIDFFVSIITARNEYPCASKHNMKEVIFRAPLNNEKWASCPLVFLPKKLFFAHLNNKNIPILVSPMNVHATSSRRK